MHKLMLIVALSLLFTTKGSAYDTLVHINARVTGNTCTVETNSKRITVKLGQIATKDFISTTITQQRTPVIPFSIKLVDCQPEASAVKVSFNGRADPIDNALLAIDATGAKELPFPLWITQELPSILTIKASLIPYCLTKIIPCNFMLAM